MTAETEDNSLQSMATEAKVLLEDINSNSSALFGFVERFIRKISDKELPTAKGISFLELKNFTLLGYLIDVTYLILRKCKGLSIEGNTAIDRLVELRTTLEKMKPINYKLKYRIDKVIRAANTGAIHSDDPLQLRPKPTDLILNEGGENEEEVDEDQESDEAHEDGPSTSKAAKKNNNVYVPPKVSAMHYNEDDSAETRKQRLLDKAKRRAMSTSVIQELRNEFDEAPEEIVEATIGKKNQNKMAKERQRYEEEYLVRLNVTKKQRSAESGRHGLTTLSSLGRDITRFENVSVLDQDHPDEEAFGRKRKATGSTPGKGGKKSFGKKKKFNKKKK